MTVKNNMNCDNSPQTIPDFYKYYSIRVALEKEEAVALSFNIDPRKIHNIGNKNLKDDEGKLYSKSFCVEYFERMELVEEGLLYNVIPNDTNVEMIRPNLNNFNRWPKAITFGFIKWCRSNNLSFPIEFESLVKNHNISEEVESEERYKEIESQKKKLAKESDKLKRKSSELEEDKVNTKNLNFYKQFAMGLLALQYGSEQVEIWQKWANRTTSDIDTKGMDLKFSKIQEDLESLNAKGINIKRAAISAKINESIYLLKHKS